MLTKIFESNFISKLVLVLVTLLPVIYLPVKFSSLLYSKFIFVYLFIAIIGIVFLIDCLRKEKQEKSLNILSLSVLLIIFSYTISTVLSKNFTISLWGRDFTTDSWVTVVGLFATTLIISSVFNKKNSLNVIWSVLITSGVVSLIQLLIIFIPALPSFGLFYSVTSNLIGKVNDLALFSSLGVVVGVLALEQVKLSSAFKKIINAIVAINLGLILMINFYLSLCILLFVGLVSYLYKLFVTKSYKDIQDKFLNPSLILVLISILGIIFGSFLNTTLFSRFNLNYLEVRPSISATIDINNQSLKENLVFGTGPATFESQWPMYKPNEILLSKFWNLDFRYGHGIILSFLTTLGVLGALAWIIFILLLVWFVGKAWFLKTKDVESKFILNTVSILTLVLWFINIFYIPTTVIFVTAFIFTGVFMALLDELNLISDRKFLVNAFIRRIFAFILIVALLFIFINVVFKFISHTYFQKAVNLLAETNDTNTSLVLFESAREFDNTDIVYRAIARVEATILLNRALSGGQISAEQANESIRKVVSSFESAVNYDKNNYINYVEFANFYSDLVAINFAKEDSYNAALNLYNQALQLKPNNPFIELSIARLEFVNKNYQDSSARIISIIRKKPDYFDAYVALSQVQFELGNRSDSINTIKEYLKIFPNDLNAMYQLAMTYIQTEDYSLAINQFEKIYEIEKREEIKQWIEDIRVKQNSLGEDFRIEDIPSEAEVEN